MFLDAEGPTQNLTIDETTVFDKKAWEVCCLWAWHSIYLKTTSSYIILDGIKYIILDEIDICNTVDISRYLVVRTRQGIVIEDLLFSPRYCGLLMHSHRQPR